MATVSVNTTLPTDFSAEAQAIARRRKMAELLQSQSMEPLQAQPTPAGGFAVPISPLQGLAKMLQAYAGVKSMERANTEERALASRRNQALADALSGIPRARAEETPAGTGMTGGLDQQDFTPPTTRLVPPSMAENTQWLGRLAQIDPQAVQIGTTVLGMQQKHDEAQLTREAKLQERAMQLDAIAANQREAREARQQAAMGAADLRREIQSNQQNFAAQQAQFAREFQAQQARQAAADRVSLTQMTQANKPPTEFQGKSALYGTRAAQSDKILRGLEDKINLPGLATKQAAQNIPLIGGILGYAGNTLLSADQQRVEQAQRDFVNAVLRQESGAVISPSEFQNAQRQYFPQPGDTPEVIEQKRRNRELAITGFERMSGPGAADIRDIRGTPMMPGNTGGFRVVGVEHH